MTFPSLYSLALTSASNIFLSSLSCSANCLLILSSSSTLALRRATTSSAMAAILLSNPSI